LSPLPDTWSCRHSSIWDSLDTQSQRKITSGAVGDRVRVTWPRSVPPANA
jgi:hypothetical protein